CLYYFSSSAKLELHSVDCGKLNDCAVRLPSKDDKWLEFKNHCRKERVPFVVYANLECALEKTDKESTSSTYTYQHHNVFSIGYYVYCSYDSSLSGYRFHRDNNCISWFADELKNLAHIVQSVISTNVPMDFTRDDWRKFNSTTHCHVCEKPFMKDDTATQKKSTRTLAKNDFEKNLYKLMNNAVFGKTIENVRDRVDVKLLTKWESRYGAEAMIAKPNFHSRSVFLENLVAIELRKLEVKFDKPIYVGMCILDISKTCLYEFHHEYMAPLFHDKCKIMYYIPILIASYTM
ncbi:hypothetical protein ALC62_05270, partial [Cyphomyrmex costatus]